MVGGLATVLGNNFVTLAPLPFGKAHAESRKRGECSVAAALSNQTFANVLFGSAFFAPPREPSALAGRLTP